MQIRILPLLVIAFSALSLTPPSAESINLTISGLRNDKGHVLVSLFNSEEGFPDKPEKVFSKKRVAIAGKQATITFSSVPPGTYAIALLHDENNDMKMNTNFLGIPKEGYGFSNNAMGTFGPPSFSKASFKHTDKASAVIIKIKY